MAAKVSLDDQLLKQLQASGEVQVEDAHGVPIVLMTVDARQKLHGITYDDSEVTEGEMMGILAAQVNDPEGMGAPGMEDYDTKYGHLFDGTNGEDQ
jgi:hypothetical protein